MSRIIVEYQTPLSVRVKKIIRDEVTPSMVSNDETSCQYEISFAKDCLDDIVEQGMQDFDLTTDLKLINDLIEDGVHYLEF